MLTQSPKEIDPIVQQATSKQSGRANTKALIDLMAELYPHLPKPISKQPTSTDSEYHEKQRKLKNRLNCARKLVLDATKVLS